MPSSSRRSDNHDLTRKAYVLTPSDRGYQKLLVTVLLVLVGLVLTAVGFRYFENHLAPASFLSDVRAENHQLREALTKARFDLEVEVATREELERQVVSLNEQLKQAREELVFLKSAGARAPGK